MTLDEGHYYNTFTFRCDNLWKSKFMALEKPGNSGNFFSYFVATLYPFSFKTQIFAIHFVQACEEVILILRSRQVLRTKTSYMNRYHSVLSTVRTCIWVGCSAVRLSYIFSVNCVNIRVFGLVCGCNVVRCQLFGGGF